MLLQNRLHFCDTQMNSFEHSSRQNGRRGARRDRGLRKILSTSQKETESVNKSFPAADNYQDPTVRYLKIWTVNLKVGDYWKICHILKYSFANKCISIKLTLIKTRTRTIKKNALKCYPVSHTFLDGREENRNAVRGRGGHWGGKRTL